MKLMQMADNIKAKIQQLEDEGKQLDTLARDKATSLTNYECELAKTVMKLKNGVSLEIEGETIINPPVSIMEKIAKGYCYKERLKAELAESSYKNCNTRIEILKAQLNGYQSINKHLSEV